MKTVILGLPQSGQAELFSLLTGISLETIAQKPLETHLGICEVKDPRVTMLSKMYKPKKTIYIRIEYALLPDFNLTGPAKSVIFNQIRNADELCWVTRTEENISSFLSELIINDLVLVEKRLETLAKDQKKKFAETREKEKELMEKCKSHLESEKLLQKLQFNPEELKIIKTYQLFSMKPIVLVINVTEKEIKDPAISKKIKEKHGLSCVQLCAELEAEIKSLNGADQKEFMQESGIDESALDKMTRVTFSTLGLISFFTVGEDEVRAWPVKSNSLAPEAGGVVHSDIEKGFVRAEVMKYEDLAALGSEEKLKQAGKFSVKGRDYVVEDGDILNFRFNI